jgi:hypothetical protein
MKTIILFLLMTGLTAALPAQVAVNSDGSPPDASAMLEVKSTDKGFLPPRMTTAQRDAISVPVEGLIIYNTDDGSIQFWDGTWWYDLSGGNDYLQYPEGMVFCTNGPTAIVDVTNPATSEIWMDRNLGAFQQATSSTDANAYGDLYQWGRFAEGHHCRSSLIHNSSLANTAVPNSGNAWDGEFIPNGSSPYDWLSTQDPTLWQEAAGTNNPCPSGYRLPAEAELNAERGSWSSLNPAGAFASPLRLPVSGYRLVYDGSLNSVGTVGVYWSCTLDGAKSWVLGFDSGGANIYSDHRAYGFSVRCIKD